MYCNVIEPFYRELRGALCIGLYGWPDKMVLDKMVRTKWYGQNGIRTKCYSTKWYRQNGTDRMVRTKWYQFSE